MRQGDPPTELPISAGRVGTEGPVVAPAADVEATGCCCWFSACSQGFGGAAVAIER